MGNIIFKPPNGIQVVVQELNASEPTDDMTRQRYPLSEPEDVAIGWDNYTGGLITGYGAGVTKAARTHMGSDTEQGNLPGNDSLLNFMLPFGFAEQTKGKCQVDKQQGRKYQCTRRGGLLRSSDESPVMGVERRE